MTPRMSVRAEARRLYAEMVGEGSPAQLGPATLTPDPSPQEPATGRAAPAVQPGGAGEQAVPAGRGESRPHGASARDARGARG